MTQFQKYAAALGGFAAAALVACALAGFSVGDQTATLLVLAAFVIAGELLPVRLPGKGAFTDELTVSAAFALAIVLMFGPLPGVAAYVFGCVAADLVNRTRPDKALFNASQSVLAVAAAAGTFALITGATTTNDVSAHLPATLAAAGAFGIVENVLTAIAAALLGSTGVVAYLRRSLVLFGWTEASLLALVPVVVAAASASAWLVPLVFVPVAGIFVGARQGMANAQRVLYDEVTGLPSREFLVRRIAEAAEDRDRRVVSLGIVAVDDLKPVLDSLGPAARDTAARGIVERLSARLGRRYELARVTAEQFGVFAGVGALEVFEREVGAAVHEAFAHPFDVADLPLEMRAFTGFAALGAHADSPEALLSSAAGAAARARAERTEFRRAAARRESPALDRLILAGELRTGIERGELTLEYQLKQALREGGADAVEALVRWNHPSLGTLGPGAFVPLAEDTGLVRSLTRWVLAEAIRQAAEWRASGVELRMGVNLSARDVTDPALPELVERLLEEHDMPGASLQLEITETQLIGDAPDAHEVLERLARMGVSWAIDDFGTGYSSLAQLHRLPVDEIKIDRSFVIAMGADGAGEAIVRSTVELARALDVRVTAEGVETQAALARVTELGCDYAQGYYVAPPAPASARRFQPAPVEPVVPIRAARSARA